MFSTIKKLQARVLALAQVLKRLDKIEAILQKHEALAKENEALWSYLDEEDEETLQSGGYCLQHPRRHKTAAPSIDEIADHISDEDLRIMKTQGDA